MGRPPYELTAHAAVVIAEREIELAWVDRTFLNPERTEADRNEPSLRHALRRIAERDDRVLRVIYNASVDPPKIVTAYFDRRQRAKP
jgi:hypothetical protein